MKRNNKILDAINKGVKLALDGYEEDNMQITSKSNIIQVNDDIIAFVVKNFVDLGLPSGTLWAKCNLGANTPEEFGNYYQWGDTKPKTEACILRTYKFLDNKGYPTRRMSKYNFDDNLLQLLPEDDAAYQYDNRMKMPTKKQFQELLRYTEHKWVNNRSVPGILFIGKNGNEMFIPGAGYIHEKLGLDGTECNVWSSTRLNVNDTDMAAVYLYASDKHNGEIAEYDRYDGFSIRPVLNRQNK